MEIQFLIFYLQYAINSLNGGNRDSWRNSFARAGAGGYPQSLLTAANERFKAISLKQGRLLCEERANEAKNKKEADAKADMPKKKMPAKRKDDSPTKTRTELVKKKSKKGPVAEPEESDSGSSDASSADSSSQRM